MVKEMKIIQKSNLRQILLNHSFVIIQMLIKAINVNTNVSFKHCSPFTRCVTHINDENIETAENLDIIMLL